MEDRAIGCVLGTKEATPLEFWVAVADEQVVRLDDVLRVETRKPDGSGSVQFYGVVDRVRTLHEGTEFDTDTFLVRDGNFPVSLSYAAHVQVTRLEPEEYLPPLPGDAVYRAAEDSLKRALHFDTMDSRIPAGLMRNGSPAYLNYSFINGEKGAHVNISGISGVATKTSYALFLLHAIFHSTTDSGSANTKKAVIFNVKGEDLFFLDKSNLKRPEYEAKLGNNPGDRLDTLGLPAMPFTDVKFCAPAKKNLLPDVVPNIDQRTEGVTAYMWSLRELCRDRLFRFLFVGEDLERGNLVYLVANVEDRLARLAVDNDKQNPKQSYLHVDEPYGEDRKLQIRTFTDLIQFLEDKLIGEEPDQRWLVRNQPGTAMALIRRLWGVREEVAHLIRGDLTEREVEQYRLEPIAQDRLLTVADINRLGAKAQMFVVGVTLRKLFLEKEKRGQYPTVFIVLDELNKYAPRDGRSPIADLLVEIAERGRSLGIILIGAQQTASEVERRVVGQAAIRVVGRLDAAEAERPEYNFLSASCKQRALFVKSGTMFVQQPEVPAPLMVSFPFPPYATRRSEVDYSQTEEAAIAADFDLF
ncbi:hypothetical protein KR51_00020240 [Rubidibacter lacunae KORDI 51-2]|uniref:ATPase n=1 Tax=Rubidibacter lacunae KORDI 51-2 TaxID=582515 RepID=U5DP14_9CHRO|nr:ATP-binding protein [Rubidibacter lacunae]ERN41450.1 hypothetical protein KR51_00020240 [Rubidibacter lacunae KORDI 51-2]